MVEYGVPAGEASTAVARSQAVLGGGAWRDRMSHTSKCVLKTVGRHLAWLTGSIDYVASFAGSTNTCP